MDHGIMCFTYLVSCNRSHESAIAQGKEESRRDLASEFSTAPLACFEATSNRLCKLHLAAVRKLD